jgi:hypothetical protein
VSPTTVKPVDVKPSKKEVTPQQDVMSFLKNLSNEIKQSTPKIPETIVDRIDAYIRDHGNRHPETTKPVK